jgi:hypothetical protein
LVIDAYRGFQGERENRGKKLISQNGFELFIHITNLDPYIYITDLGEVLEQYK